MGEWDILSAEHPSFLIKRMARPRLQVVVTASINV